MRGFGYKDNLEINDRRFQIQTGCDPEKRRIIAEVFEKGQFIYSDVVNYADRESLKDQNKTDYVRDVTFDLHSEVLEEIRVLFHVKDRIKQITQYLPHYRLGKVFFAKNFFYEAIESLQNAINLKPDFIRAYKILGLCYMKIREYENAATILDKALQIKPEFPDILDCQGVVYTHLARYELARHCLQKAIKIKPSFIESNFNLGVLLFVTTLRDIAEDENIVIPVRVLRALKEIRSLKHYQEQVWQNQFEQVLEILTSGKRNEVIQALFDLQLKIATRNDYIGTTVDYFLLKFMFGGRELTKTELEYYEKKIREEAVGQHEEFADYWNELGVIHLIQCRDYFLKALDEVNQAVRLNPKYDSASHTLEMMKHSKKGFLILLRALLK